MVTFEEYKAALGDFAKSYSDKELQRAYELSLQLSIVLFDMWTKETKKKEETAKAHHRNFMVELEKESRLLLQR